MFKNCVRQELWNFKYSLIRAIKSHCPNLEKLSLLMTCKNTAGQFSSPHILPELRIRAYKCFLQQVMLMSKYRVKE